MLPSFTVFGFIIPMYGVLSASGMLAAFVLLALTRKYTRFSEDHVLSVIIWAVISGFLGAKILYWLVEWKQVVADPAFLLRTLREGFVFYGSLLGGLIGVYGDKLERTPAFDAYRKVTEKASQTRTSSP